MSSMLEEMLVYEVVPRLRIAARSIPKVASEDGEEIIQEATLMAARMMDSAEMARARVGSPTCGRRASGMLPMSREIRVPGLQKRIKESTAPEPCR